MVDDLDEKTKKKKPDTFEEDWMARGRALLGIKGVGVYEMEDIFIS